MLSTISVIRFSSFKSYDEQQNILNGVVKVENVTLHHGNCLDILKTIPSESVDLVVTDPPYKVISGGSLTSKNSPTGILAKNDGKIFEHNSITIEEWLPDVYRVLKQNTHCYIMCNLLNLWNYKEVAEKVGFKVHNLLVWEKNNCTPNRWYMKNHEYILFLYKGKAKAINMCGSKTIHTFENPKNKVHPTEKPIALMQLYVENSSQKDDLVLDPFMGGGSVGIACVETGRHFIGAEIDTSYFNIAQQRILQGKQVEET